jgi:hypothetical protein
MHAKNVVATFSLFLLLVLLHLLFLSESVVQGFRNLHVALTERKRRLLANKSRSLIPFPLYLCFFEVEIDFISSGVVGGIESL